MIFSIQHFKHKMFILGMQEILILSLLTVTSAEDSDVTKFMKHLKVIPDVIEEGPEDFLKITYDSGILADKGVELKPSQVKNQPKVEWKAANSANVFYTLIMTDPDASDKPESKMEEWQHWLVANIPGNDLSKGQVLSEYIGAGPPKDTGLHRYVFLLYKQPTKLQFDESHLVERSAEGRYNFSTKKFVTKYKLGVPVAGNFFQAQWDDYVPELQQQIKLKL